MKFDREKKLLLGGLALLCPLPLPFNEVLEWPLLGVYCLLVISYLQRVERGAPTGLPLWLLNVLGLLYLPIFFFDMRLSILSSGGFVTPLLHLILFLLIVKLWALRREREKWHVLVATFFVFVGAMATSSHLTVALYLFAFMVFGLLVLARFATFHALVAYGHAPPGARSRPRLRAPIAITSLLVVAFAVPLFAFMPRLHEPYVFGRGSGAGGLIRTTGFSDGVDLNLTSTIRNNRSVVMRVQYEDNAYRPREMRFKGATYDLYRNRNWRRQQVGTTLGNKNRRFLLVEEEGAGEAVTSADIFLQPLGSRSLILPLEARALEIGSVGLLEVGPGGAIALPGPPNDTLSYRVELAAEPQTAKAHRSAGVGSPRDEEGITPRMRQLAAEVMGTGTDAERAERLQRHLITSYGYTVDFVGRGGSEPLDDFLFVHKSGHCELFASAMVLMLRSQDIPARLVTGFLGAEPSPIEAYFIVRQQNAHAWVEAFISERGWTTFDPTPPEGRPTANRDQSLLALFTQLYDYLLFRWDRYVLTYGAEDQESFFERLRETVAGWWRRLTGGESEEEAPASPPGPAALEAPADEEPTAVWKLSVPLPIAALLVLLVAALVVAYLSRRPLTARRAYEGLRERLDRGGLEVTEALAPLELQRLAVERYPAAATATRQLVGLYLRESFAGRHLDPDQRRNLRPALDTVAAAIRTAAKRRRR